LYTKLSIAIPIIGALLFVFVLSVLFRTSCTDPGILPRSEKDEILFNEKQAMIASELLLKFDNNKQKINSCLNFENPFKKLIKQSVTMCIHKCQAMLKCLDTKKL
jgi:hypothetical protein